MKNLAIIVCLLVVLPALGQDTLYFSSGRVEIGSILAIDSIADKLAFKDQANRTRVTLLSSVNRIGFDLNPPENPSYFTTPINMSNGGSVKVNTSGHSYFFSAKSKYDYGTLMLSTNLFSPLHKGNNFPLNNSVSLGAEYLLTENIGLLISYTSGLDFKHPPSDTVTSYLYVNRNELVYRITIAAKFYPYGQARFALFFTPLVQFGKLAYVDQKSFTHFSISPETGLREVYEATTYLYTRKKAGLSEFGAGLGILFNLTKSINFSSQANLYSSNSQKDSYSSYHNFRSESYYVTDYWDDSAYRTTQVRLQFHLVIRFGGTKR